MMPPVHWDTIITGLISAGILGGVRALIKAFKVYSAESHAWRKRIESKVNEIESKTDTAMGSMQATMRHMLSHNYEKYQERRWLTPEERASWYDMHDKYAAMGFNGLIDTYRQKLNDLPDREI